MIFWPSVLPVVLRLTSGLICYSVIWIVWTRSWITRTVRFSLFLRGKLTRRIRPVRIWSSGSWRSPNIRSSWVRYCSCRIMTWTWLVTWCKEWTCGWIPRPVRRRLPVRVGRRLPWMESCTSACWTVGGLKAIRRMPVGLCRWKERTRIKNSKTSWMPSWFIISLNRKSLRRSMSGERTVSPASGLDTSKTRSRKWLQTLRVIGCWRITRISSIFRCLAVSTVWVRIIMLWPPRLRNGRERLAGNGIPCRWMV